MRAASIENLTLKSADRTPLASALERLTRLVSPCTGILGNLYEEMVAPDEGSTCHFTCELISDYKVTGDLRPLRDAGVERREVVHGRHRIRQVALAAALGEGAERYSATFIPAWSLPYATTAELGDDAVGPACFSFFHETQLSDASFPYSPVEKDVPLRWVQGFQMPDCTPRWVPAQLAFFSNDFLSLDPPEPPITDITSSGLACGATPEEAILTAILELIERDAFALTWYNHLTLPLLDWNTSSEMKQIDDHVFSPSCVEYRVVNLSVFHEVPTALAVVRGRPSDPCPLTLGAAAAVHIEHAWEKALTEALGGRAHMQRTHPEDLRREFRKDLADLVHFDDHVAYYTTGNRARHTRFLDSSDKRQDPASVPPVRGATVVEQIESITRRLSERGISLYVVDVTAPDIRDAGLHVFRALSADLCPLDFAYKRRFLGRPRLYTAAYELGLRESPLTVADLNHWPHPFP